MAGSEHEPVLSSLQGPFRAIASVVLPSPDALEEEGWLEAEGIIEKALVPRPPSVKRQIRLFLRLVNILPVFSTGRTLARLPLERRAAFLQKLHRSPLMPFRRGLWGIRTLIFMGYYNQDAVREGIGYGADPWGWAAHFGDKLEKKSASHQAENMGGNGSGLERSRGVDGA